MIEFMVLGLPRSGTTWAANWLTTDQSLCLHDPLNEYHYNDIDKIESYGRRLGVACTGLYLWTDWLNKHPARKVILHRPVGEIKYSLREHGIHLKIFKPQLLHRIEGFHVDWRDLFNNPKPIYEFLLKRKFDPLRHEFLNTYNVQVDFNKTKKDMQLLNTLLNESKRFT
jgi:hypothetical protein